MSELSKLKWRCRRGVKELDVVLNKYLEEYYENNYEHEKTAFKSAFKELLEFDDPILYDAMLLGNIEPVNSRQREILCRLGNINSSSIKVLPFKQSKAGDKNAFS